MRYTRSHDGKRRATLHLGATVRLTREELHTSTRMVKRLGYQDLYEYCAFHIKQQLASTLPAAYEAALDDGADQRGEPRAERMS